MITFSPMIKHITLIVLAVFALTLSAQTLKAESLNKRINEGIEILASKQKSQNPMPAALLAKAKGIAIIEVTRGGIGIGGSGGSGIILTKTASGGWSAPIAFNQGGATVGLQLGFDEKKYIYVIMTDEMLQHFLGDDQFNFDAKATGTAGPNNVSEIATAPSSIYIYQTSKGAFGGATIGGQWVKADADANREAYGIAVVTKEIASGKIPAPASAATLYNLLKLSK